MAEHVVTMEICRFLALIEKAQMVIEDHIYELNKITVCLKTFDTPTFLKPPFAKITALEFSPIMPDEVREHLTRDQRPSFIQNHSRSFRFTAP